MAHIFLASIDGPDGFSKTCVIKRILPEYASLDAFSRMFADEAKVAALLSHPNIVQVFDFGKIDGQYYLAMEWIQGESLDRLMRHASKLSIPLGPRVAVDVGIAVSAALDYAHAKTLPDGTPLQLVHRDITPGNVLVSREGIIKLGDFGIVKSTVNLDRTVAGVVKGKYAYMSPEQISNRPLDHRSDLFSLGIVLYELSTGRRLFKRETIEATILATSQAEVPPPSEVSPGFPPALESILLRLLAKDPNARYQSAHELHDDLERFRGSQGWTSGGRELALLVNKVFPPDAAGKRSVALSSSDTSSNTGLGSARTPGRGTGLQAGSGSGPSSFKDEQEIDTGVHEMEPPAPPPPQAWMMREGASQATSFVDAGAQPEDKKGPSWGILAAAGIAIIGSALFWYFIA
jgi:serine/threonine-protein kinase